MIDVHRIPELFVDVADTLVAEFDLLEFLHRLTEHAATVSGASAVGLMMLDQNDVLRIVIALVAVAIIAGAVIISKRREVTISDDGDNTGSSSFTPHVPDPHHG